MAKIYTNQIAAKSAAQHKFKGDPLQNYIAEGIKSVTAAATQVTEMVNDINDREAASKMEEAKQRALQTITDWDDFTDDYLTKMENAATAIWDDAFSTIGPTTQTRFLRNNPEVRNLFQLTVASASTARSYEYAKAEYERHLPNVSSGIVKTKDPVAMQERMKQVENEINASFLKPEDKMKMVSDLYYNVATSAVYSAIGRRDFEMANGMIDNGDFMVAVSAREREQLKSAVQNAILNSVTVSDSDAATKARIQKDTALGVGVIDTIMRDESLGSKDERFKLSSAFLTAMLNADKTSLDSFHWAGKMQMYEFLDAVSAIPSSERQALVQNIAEKAFPNSEEMDTAIGQAQANVNMLLKRNEGTNFDEWSSDDVSLAFDLVTTYKDIMSFSPELRKAIAPLKDVVGREVLADTIELSGLGPSEFEYSRTGAFDSFKDLNPGAQIAAALNAPVGAGEVVYDKRMNQVFADATYKLASRLNNGKTPENGTYVEAVARTAVALGNADAKMKRALGIDGADSKTLSLAMWKKRHQLAAEGKLNDHMSGGSLSGDLLPTEQQSSMVRDISSIWGGAGRGQIDSLTGLAERTADNSMDITPIEQSEDYAMLKDMILTVAPDATPDEQVLKIIATKLRQGRHEYNGWVSSLFTDVDAYLRGDDNYVERKWKQVMSSPITE